MTMLVRGGAVIGSALPATATTGQVLQWNGSAWVAATPSASGTTPNATPTVPGLVQLAGDLAGTATAPMVTKLNGATPAAVATSGAYTDLTGRPALAPVATSGSYGDLTSRPLLAPVATSGAYADLTGAPAVPAVQTAYKATPSTVTNTTTKTADPALQFASVTPGTYVFEVEATQTITTSGPNLSWSITGTATFTGTANGMAIYGNGSTTSEVVSTAAAGGTVTNAGSATAQPFRVAVPVVVTAAGSLAFTWGQQNASLTSVTVNAGAWARLTKVA